MKQIDDSKIMESNAEIEAKLKKEREEWGEKIKTLIESIKDTAKVVEAQVYQLSYRQIIVENMINYRVLAEKQQEALDKQICARYREYSIGSELKLNNTEKTQFSTADLSAWKLRLKLLTSHIEWCQETIKTLDQAGFFVKNKIQVVSEMMC